MNALEISCRLELLPGDSLPARFEAARRFGFDGVSLPGRFMSDWLTPMREHLPDCPLPRFAISLGFESSLLHPDASERTRCRESIVRLLDIAAELGVPRLNVAPVLICDNPVRIQGPDARETQDRLLKEQLPGLGDEARSRNVTFLLEPVNRYESDYLNSIVHAAAITREINHPNVAITADLFHMQMEELDPAAALRAAADQLGFVHVAENTRIEPGVGSLDFKSPFAALQQSGYNNGIELESRSLSGPAEEVLSRSVVYLNQVWGIAHDSMT